MKTKHAMILVSILLAAFAPFVNAAKIKVSVDRNPVNINDSFQLVFSATESPDDDPDFAPLHQDFEILNQQQSSNTSWVNGNFSKSIKWTLHVMAKRSGRLLIPAVSFGDDVTQALTIMVTQSNTKNNIDEELFLEVEASPEKPFVQTQVLYTLRFYRRVQITKASLNEPELENAVIEKLGEDSNYTTQINGVNFAVTERKYAIFPQQSGAVTIAPMVLNAEVVNNQQPRFNGFFRSQSTKTKRVKSRAITLDVQPVPQNYKASHWLGAEQVYIEEKWSDDSLKVKVGEPLTRTLTLLTKGATVGQLPELGSLSGSEDLKTYPDQPLLNEQKTAEGLLAFREEKIAFIPSRPGSYVLPAIEVPWFNTQTQQVEVARLAGRTINAIAAAKSSTPTPVIAAPETQTDITQKTVIPAQQPDLFWMWVSLFLAAGWILTVVFVIRHRFTKTQEKPIDEKQLRIKDAVKSLKKACSANDAQAAKKALLLWGRIRFGATSLSAITPFCEARLRDEITVLNQYLYSVNEISWQGKKLYQAFAESNARQQIKQAKEDALEPLYRT